MLFISAETEPEPIDLINIFGPWTRYELLLRIEFIAEDKIQGLIFVAGLIAKKCAKNNPNLGYYKDKFEPDQKSNLIFQTQFFKNQVQINKEREFQTRITPQS